jgi:hypothetical protein
MQQFSGFALEAKYNYSILGTIFNLDNNIMIDSIMKLYFQSFRSFVLSLFLFE